MAKPSIRKLQFSKNNNPYLKTSCKGCGKIEWRRSDAVKIWSGHCRKCACKEREQRPNIKPLRKTNYQRTLGMIPLAIRSERSRQQVLRQGGVPNAKKFTNAEGDNYKGKDSHWAWKGGLTQKGRAGFYYNEWRKSVFERDDYTCQFCGQQGGRLEVDHILPYSTHVELRYELSNGRTLCNPCHRTTDTYGFKALKYKAC